MYFPNNSYTRVFIKPRTLTKLRTLGQLRHRNVAIMDQAVSFHVTVYIKNILTVFQFRMLLRLAKPWFYDKVVEQQVSAFN